MVTYISPNHTIIGICVSNVKQQFGYFPFVGPGGVGGKLATVCTSLPPCDLRLNRKAADLLIGSFYVDEESPIFPSPWVFQLIFDRAPTTPLPTTSERRGWFWFDLGACASDSETDSFLELKLTTSYACTSVIFIYNLFY